MTLWRALPFLVFIVLIAFFLKGLFLDPQTLPSVQIGKPLPSFTLPTFNDEPFRSTSMRDNVALLNVWASWCEACRDEHMYLMELAQKDIPIYGLNYKDNQHDASHWLKEWGNPYRRVGIDKDGLVAMNLGVYGTPETFLIDKKGIIRLRHVGVLTKQIWTEQFLPLMNDLAEKKIG